jgi:hypothetical protein
MIYIRTVLINYRENDRRILEDQPYYHAHSNHQLRSIDVSLAGQGRQCRSCVYLVIVIRPDHDGDWLEVYGDNMDHLHEGEMPMMSSWAVLIHVNTGASRWFQCKSKNTRTPTNFAQIKHIPRSPWRRENFVSRREDDRHQLRMRAEPQISHLPVQSTQKDLRVPADYCTPRVTSLGKNGISSEQRLQRYFERVREILQTSPFFDIFIASETTHRSCTLYHLVTWKTVSRDKRRTFCSLPSPPLRNDSGMRRESADADSSKGQTGKREISTEPPIIQTKELSGDYPTVCIIS